MQMFPTKVLILWVIKHKPLAFLQQPNLHHCILVLDALLLSILHPHPKHPLHHLGL